MEKMQKPIIGGIFGTKTEWDESGNVTVKDEFHLRIYWDLWHSGAMKKLKGNMLHVYLTIAMHLDQRGEGWPTQERIAKLCGINRETVVNAIKKLVKEGFIEAEKTRSQGKFDKTIYKIKFAPKPSNSDHDGKSDMAKMPENQGFHHVGKTNTEKLVTMSEKPTRKNRHGKSDTKKDINFKKESSLKKDFDDDGSQSSNLLKSKKQADTEPQTDPRYQLLNQLFAVNGFDVAKKTEHQDKFFDTLREISFEKLMECATKYISLVRENKHEHAAAQIVWFLAGGYKNFLRQERPQKQRKQNSQPMPEAIRKQLEEAKNQVSATTEEDKPLSEEEFEEKRRRIMEKIRMMAQMKG